MELPDTSHDSGFSRRGFIAGTTGLVAGHALTTTAAASGSLSVMTRNLAVGVELFDVEEASTLDELRDVAGQLYEDFRRYPFGPRAEAIADEIEATSPDVVGLQEAMLVRTQQPSTFEPDGSPSASNVEVDFLDVLSGELAARGLDYDVAISNVTTDIEVPADVDGEEIDVRLTDHVAILVRGDTEVRDARGGTFETSRSMPIGSDGLERGYCQVDVPVDGTDVTVATTHLESSEPVIRQQQAEELLDRLPTDRPILLAGDFNSGPDSQSSTYDYLTTYFEDAHTTLQPDRDGHTCCQDGDLLNEESQLSRRIDAVLYLDSFEPTTVERVGADPEDRVVVEDGDEDVRLWPSDHAGVVAGFEVDFDGSTDDGTLGAMRDSGSDSSPVDALPGFGFGAALTGLGGAYLLARRRED